jgi:hypothetical protein
MYCFYTSAFSTLCFVLSATDDKNMQRICINFCMKLCNSATKTLEMLCEAFEEHTLSQMAVFEWHTHFKVSRVPTENDNERSGSLRTSTTGNVEKSENSSTKTVTKQSMSLQTPLGSVMEFARRS